MNLSSEAFERARAFIESNARPLEVARMRFHFDGGAAEAVIAELATYQNADGGFGNALESDLRTPESSALATTVAFQILEDVGGSGAEEMGARAVGYLLNTYDAEKLRWVSIPEAAQDSPHAPWWEQAELEGNFGGFLLNPTAEVVGHLVKHRQHVPDTLLETLLNAVLARVTARDKIEMHDLLCCNRLVTTEGLDPAYRAALLAELRRLVDGAVARDPAAWTGYALRPVQVADAPDSPFMEALGDSVAANLDYVISEQQEDGSWPVTWSWYGLYPDVWENTAKIGWAGVITLDTLRLLKRYGRIEGAA